MSIEQSHGKARPGLPRSGDLATPKAEDKRNGKRGPGGRFAPGNDIGRGRGWRNLIRKSLGATVSTELVERLCREAWTLHLAFMRELPFDGAQVTALSAARARWTALASYFATRGAELGLETDKGQRALELSMRLDQRAERLAVTALDIATKLANAKASSGGADVVGAIREAAKRRAATSPLALVETTGSETASADASAGRVAPSNGGRS